MITLGERWSLRVDGIVLAVVTSLAVVAAARTPAPPPPRIAITTIDQGRLELATATTRLDLALRACADEPSKPACPAPTGATHDPIRAQADQLYRAKQFDQASAVVRAAAHGNPELVSLATLYHQLDRAWTYGMSPGGRATDVFEALEQARKLDVVLGGVFCDELQRATIHNVAHAAISYTARRDYSSAEHAVAVADAFGVNSDAIKLVRRKLQQVRLQAGR